MEQRQAFIKIDPQFLHRLLQLPDDVTIVHISVPRRRDAKVTLLLSGDRMPLVRDGNHVPTIDVEYKALVGQIQVEFVHSATNPCLD